MADKQLSVRIVSLQKTLFDGPAQSVYLPGTVGAFEVLPGHAAIISSLEKWFNVTIHIDNPEVLAYRITAKLDNLSLEQVMNNLSYVSNLKYKIDKREVWLM